MKRIHLLIIPMVVLLLLFVALAIANTVRVPPWRKALDAYLDGQDLSEEMIILEVKPARMPGLFTPDMSRVSFGDGLYYRVDREYDGQAGRDSKPLPYPPQRVMCVLIGPAAQLAGDSRGQQVLFVTLHQDLYNAAWIVHQGANAPFTDEFKYDLSQISCALGISH